VNDKRKSPEEEPGKVVQGPWGGLPGPSQPRDNRQGPGEIESPAGAGLAGVEDFELHPPSDMHLLHCYRHPDRETGVSCSNCGRPICWECMTPAPVGFHCPECMGQARVERRAAPVITRGQIRDRWAGGMGGRAPVTRALVVINVLMFIVEIAMGAGGGLLAGISGRTAFDLGAMWPPSIAIDGEYWRLVSPMFLHASIFHILFNMWALWVVGGVLEPMIGSARFAGVYFVAGFAGNAFAFAIGSPVGAVVGASTAIFGIFGALFILALHDRSAMSGAMVRSVGILLAINLAFTFLARGVSWEGHIGGLIGGVLAVEALVWFGRRRLAHGATVTDALLLAAVAALFVLLVIWRVQTFPALQ
jgi:membrane associated rhomboid family serine protease